MNNYYSSICLKYSRVLFVCDKTRFFFQARRVASQQSSEPAQTISAPCQKDSESGALSNTAASAEESTGVK